MKVNDLVLFDELDHVVNFLLVDITQGDKGALPASAGEGGHVALQGALLLPQGSALGPNLPPAPHPGPTLQQAEPAPGSFGV